MGPGHGSGGVVRASDKDEEPGRCLFRLYICMIGAEDGIRTRDLLLGKETLYH